MDYQALDEALAYLNGEESFENAPIYESLQDEFNFDILLILAEQEMFENFSGLMLESADVEVLNEGIRETIMNYVQKIVLGIQKVWDKFINLFSQKELEYLKTKVKPMIEKSPDLSFTINNYKSYDYPKMNDIRVVPFDYERMKENLNSVNEFINAEYGGKLNLENSKNVKEALMKYMNFKVEEQYKVGQKELEKIYEFAVIDYFEYRKNVQEDIEVLNRSNESIKNMLNQVVDAENQQNAANESFEFATDMFLHEAPNETGTNNNNDPAKSSMSFTDGENNKTNPNNKEQADRRKTVTKSVTTYMSASTKILSAKMSILSKSKRETFMILNHFYNSKKTNATAVEPKNKTENINTDQAAQVNTEIRKK